VRVDIHRRTNIRMTQQLLLGGYRYMHLYLKRRDHLHLLFLLDKDEQEDLTTEQRRTLRLMVAELKGL